MLWVVSLLRLNNFEQLKYEYDLMIDKIHEHVHFQIEVLRHVA